MKVKSIYKYFITVFFAILIVLFPFFESAFSKKIVNAEESKLKNYDETPIEDDLSDIDISLYPKLPLGEPNLIRFQEYCYSEKPFYKEAYGLYFYVYNPTETPVSKMGNEVNMAVAYNDKGDPISYDNIPITLLDEAYNGRFLKFKVTDDIAFLERVQTYAKENGGKRRYDVVGIQLYYEDGRATDSDISKQYIWTGFAKGMSSNEEDTISLSCTALDTLSLDCFPTYYRPNGSNGTNSFTQDTLHSVYFSVPNDKIAKYGEISAVKAHYLGAVLKPMLCTGNEDAYNAIWDWRGINFTETFPESKGYNSNLNYTYLTNIEKVSVDGVGPHYAKGFNAFEGMNLFLEVSENGNILYDQNNSLTFLTPIDAIYLLFGTDTFAENSADSYSVSSIELKDAMARSAEVFGGELIQGAEHSYSKEIFSSVDKDYTPVEYTPKDEFSLTSEVISKDFWDKLFGTETVETSTLYDGIKAVHKVSKNDFTGNKIVDSKNLFINSADYGSFVDFYNKSTTENKSVYLFRYRISEYKSSEATLFQHEYYLGIPGWKEKDTNAYFFESAVDLDFDIIQVSMTDKDGTTVLGVVADPIDNTPGSDAPIHTKGEKPTDLKSLFLTLLALLLVIPVVLFLVKKLIDFIFTLPSFTVGAISNTRQRHYERKRGRKRK